MAISFVGSAEASNVSGGDVTLDLTGISLAENDLVIVAYAIGSDNGLDRDLVVNTPTGYIEVADLFSNDTQDVELGVFYKVQGATPDTSVVLEGFGGMDDSVAAVAMAFRGVDPTTPMDATATTATGIDTFNPDPPSIDLVTAGAWTVIAGASGHILGGAGTYTFPTGYTTDAIDRGADDADDVTVGMGYKSSPSDPENPGVMTHSGTDSTIDAWCAATLALRPAPAGPEIISATESLKIAASETVIGAAEMAVAESLAIVVPDATALLASFDGAESLAVPALEATSAAFDQSAAESLAVAAAEAFGDMQIQAEPTDSLRVSTTEAPDSLDVRLSAAESAAAGLSDTLGSLLATLEAVESQALGLADGIALLLASFDAQESLAVVLGTETGDATSPPAIVDAAESLAVSLLEVLGDIQARIEPAEPVAIGLMEVVGSTEAFLDPQENVVIGLDEGIEARATLEAAESLRVATDDALSALLALFEAVETLRVAATETGTATGDEGVTPTELDAVESLGVALTDLAHAVSATAEALHVLVEDEARADGSQYDVLVSAQRIANRLELRLAGVATETQRATLEKLAKDVQGAAVHAYSGKTPRLTKWESRSIATIKKMALAVFGDQDWVRDLRGPREDA